MDKSLNLQDELKTSLTHCVILSVTVVIFHCTPLEVQRRLTEVFTLLGAIVSKLVGCINTIMCTNLVLYFNCCRING